ncbi:MAG: helix-turn-helix domain-containing protein [Proteobacteria bacterium]|nr:helix-turn-helix domain-containing protein [Pseudomonadota bacterium]
MDWRKLIGSPYCNLPSGQKHILTVMARYGDKCGDSIYPSQREIAFRAGVSQRTVANAMQRAEHEGWIIRHSEFGHQGYKRHSYELAVPEGVLNAVELMLKTRFWEPPYTHKLARQSARVFLVERSQT